MLEGGWILTLERFEEILEIYCEDELEQMKELVKIVREFLGNCEH